jgi:hypothetical protein
LGVLDVEDRFWLRASHHVSSSGVNSFLSCSAGIASEAITRYRLSISGDTVWIRDLVEEPAHPVMIGEDRRMYGGAYRCASTPTSSKVKVKSRGTAEPFACARRSDLNSASKTAWSPAPRYTSSVTSRKPSRRSGVAPNLLIARLETMRPRPAIDIRCNLTHRRRQSTGQTGLQVRCQRR